MMTKREIHRRIEEYLTCCAREWRYTDSHINKERIDDMARLSLQILIDDETERAEIWSDYEEIKYKRGQDDRA